METSEPKRGLYKEMEQNAQVAAKRLWKIVQIVFCVLKTGTVKSKFMLDLNLMLKRGNKAITNLRRRSSFTTNVSSSTRIRDYEFSCSNTPKNDHFPYMSKRKRRFFHGGCDKEDDTVATAVKKAVAVAAAAVESPLIMFPEARQLRVTDSPFPLEDGGDQDHVVDKAAEEFIKKFYKNLKLQKKMCNTLESPYYDGWVR